MRHWLIIGILLAGLSTVSAQVVAPDSLTSRLFSRVLALDMSENSAGELFPSQTGLPDPWAAYLSNYRDFLITFITEDEAHFHQWDDARERYMKIIEAMPDTDPYRNYLLANINLQRALVSAKFDAPVQSALSFNKAYRLLSDNAVRFPGFEPNTIGMGVVHTLIGVVPDSYQWLLTIINMEGSVSQGRQELISALELSSTHPAMAMYRPEILFYLAFIDMNLYSDQSDNDQLMALVRDEAEQSLLMHFLLADLLMHDGRNDEAIAVLNDTAGMHNYLSFAYLDYLRGECYLRRLDTRRAREHYRKFGDTFHGRNYLIDARRKKAWTYLIDGDTTRYRQLMQEISRGDEGETGIDREAWRESQRATLPEVSLIEARLLFDGGYYDRALRILDQATDTSPELTNRVERCYRRGRILDLSGQDSLAKEAYLKTMALGEGLPDYFAANAALILGKYYEQHGQTAEAVEMYNRCLDMDFRVYRNSIRTKAKQQLNRLED